MHLTLTQLLAARDGEPLAVTAQQHIERCGDCRDEIERLDRVRMDLRVLPAFEPPIERWTLVREGVRRSPGGRLRASLAACAAGLVTIVLTGLFWSQSHHKPGHFALRETATINRNADNAEPLAVPGLSALMGRSVELERTLRSLPPRRVVEPAGTATMIDGLERRIAWVDYQLTWASESGLTPAQSQRLWDERVDLLDSLIILRSAQAPQLDF